MDATRGLLPANIDKLRKSEAGSAIVEFSLVLLPLLGVLFLTMDVAWSIFAWACIQEGAREGVRYAITGSGQAESSLDTATKLVVQQYSFGFAAPANINIDYYPSSGYSSAGMPASLDGTPQATQMGNIVKITVQGITIGSFAPIYVTPKSIQLAASASDVMQ